jgi:hypothetical protein
MPPEQKMATLFDKIDSSGSGSITKAQFEQAFASMHPPPAIKAMGADAIFGKLDPNGTGSVSKQDFTQGMTQLMQQVHKGHHHRAGGASVPSGASAAVSSSSPVSTAAASTRTLSTLGEPTAPSSPWTGSIVNTVA